jgi:outer membrane protein
MAGSRGETRSGIAPYGDRLSFRYSMVRLLLRRLLLPVCALAASAFAAGTVSAQVPAVPRAPVPANPALDSAGPLLSLADALKLARDHNPTYLQSGVARKLASATLRAAYGQWLPQLTASIFAQYQEAGSEVEYGQQLGASSAYDLSQYQIGLTYTLNASVLFSPSVQRANRDAAQADLTAAGMTLRTNVVTAYLTVLQDEAQVSLQDTLVADDSVQLMLATAKSDAGAATPLDVERAKVTLTQQQVSALQARNAVDVAKLALFQQIGVPQPQGVQLQDAFVVSPPPLSLDSAMALARLANPQIAALRARERAADADVTRQRGLYTPTLQIQTGIAGQAVQYTNNNYLPGLFQSQLSSTYATCAALDTIGQRTGLAPRQCGPPSLTPTQIQQIQASNNQFPFKFQNVPRSITATLSLPLFDGFNRELSVQQATANRQNAEYNLRARDLQLTADVTTAYLNVTAAARTAAMQEENTATARQALELATERYSVGAGTFLDVTDSRAAFERAETDRINAVYTFHQQFAALENAVGRPLR